MENLVDHNKFDNIFKSILSNWIIIQKNHKIQKNINMKTNNLCKIIRYSNKCVSDYYIQAYILSMYIYFLVDY